ncbi:MAG: type II secretion system secretin GspD [Candidatus Sedimenticola sp. PURPLELP]
MMIKSKLNTVTRRWRRRLVAGILAFNVTLAFGGGITLNLDGADIKTLVTVVSEATGTNFIVDPRVKGKVTVVSAKPMDENELYQVFLSILDVHGFAAVESGDVIRIIPETTAKQTSVPVATAKRPGNGDQVVSRLIELKHVPARELVPLLRPLIPQDGSIAAHASSNILIVTDRARNLARLMEIISRIDTVSEGEIEIIPLRHAAASEVVRLATQLVGRTQVATKEGGSEIGVRLVADERSNTVLLSGDSAARLRFRTMISHLDTPLETKGNTQVIYLRYANAKELVPVLQEISNIHKPEAGQKGPAQLNKVAIQAHESSNALVISAPPDTMNSLREVIRGLDTRRAQVLVEVVIAEVTTDKTGDLGINWTSSLGTQKGFIGGVAQPGDLGGTDALGAAGTALALGSGLNLGYVIGGTVRALLRALATDGKTNILSTPTLVTLDNEEATITVGDNVPFVTGQYTNDNSTPDNPFQTIERKDVGIVLKVKPQINEGDAVMLELNQEVSAVDSTTAGSELRTKKRQIQTKVLVNDGDMLVLGGLMQDTSQESHGKVPGLGDVPVVGNLFKSRSAENHKTNLMVFLKPTIMRDAEDGITHTSRKYYRMRDTQARQKHHDVRLLLGEKPNILPSEMEQCCNDPEERTTEPPEEAQTTSGVDWSRISGGD